MNSVHINKSKVLHEVSQCAPNAIFPTTVLCTTVFVKDSGTHVGSVWTHAGEVENCGTGIDTSSWLLIERTEGSLETKLHTEIGSSLRPSCAGCSLVARVHNNNYCY